MATDREGLSGSVAGRVGRKQTDRFQPLCEYQRKKGNLVEHVSRRVSIDSTTDTYNYTTVSGWTGGKFRGQ
jgi:hypothetical protein